MITADHYNDLVRRAARNQRRRGVNTPGNGNFIHRWAVSADRVDSQISDGLDFGINPLTGKPFFSDSVFQQKTPGESATDRVWSVTVRPGCVNDEDACIEYFAQNDPRGWQMPTNYAPYARAQKIFGQNYKFVDRPLWEDDRPVVLVTAPSGDGKSLGGFVKTADHRRPEWFRTEDAWEYDLYQASVFVSLTPFKADPTALSLATGGARARRWRILVGQPPASTGIGSGAGVSGIAARELATLWLLRTPGKPEEDTIEVQQHVFWDLASRAIIDVPFLELIGAATMAADLGLLALSLAGGSLGLSLAVGALGVEESVIALLMQNLDAIVAATSGVEFWTV